MTEDNVVLDAAHGRRRCLACFRIAKSQATVMRPEVVAAVEQALKDGATVDQIIQGRPAGYGYVLASPTGGYFVDVARDNFVLGMTASIWQGSSQTYRTDLGATAP